MVFRPKTPTPPRKAEDPRTPETPNNTPPGRVLCTVLVTFQWRIQDFPEEGAPTPRGGGATYDFAKFSQKLHEIERIWTATGGASLTPPLDPPQLFYGKNHLGSSNSIR